MSDDYKVLQIMLYCVEVRGNGFRWFKDKDEAIFFASSYYNVFECFFLCKDIVFFTSLKSAPLSKSTL